MKRSNAKREPVMAGEEALSDRGKGQKNNLPKGKRAHLEIR